MGWTDGGAVGLGSGAATERLMAGETAALRVAEGVLSAATAAAEALVAVASTEVLEVPAATDGPAAGELAAAPHAAKASAMPPPSRPAEANRARRAPAPAG
jgi:hypothetical protein